MQFDKINASSLIDDVVNALQSAADNKKISINTSCNDIKLNCVPHLFYEIVYNLVDNAIRYNKVGGTIEISLKRGPSAFELRVKDSGIGIPKDSLDRIFERFYRVDKSRSRESGGTGLGLSIVKHIAFLFDAEVFFQPGIGVLN